MADDPYIDTLRKIAAISYDTMVDWSWKDTDLQSAQRRGAALEKISELILDLEDAQGVDIFE